MDSITLNLATALLGILSVASISYIASRKASRYPPGPKGWPIIGNLLDAPRPGYEWLDYHELCKKHGSDMVYSKIFGQSILVLDSIEAINELLDKRSNIYSDRPQYTMALGLMEWYWSFSFLPYGNHWRAHRRLFHSEFNIRGVSWHHQQQTRSVHDFLLRLLESPGQWQNHIKHQMGAAILDVAYGIKVLPENDPLIDLAENAMSRGSSAIIPGRYLVDTVPMLKHIPAWMPGASFQREAQEVKPILHDMADIPFQRVKKAMADGTARPSFTLNCLQNIDANGDVEYQELVIKGSAATMFIGGAETSVSTISSFFLAMIKYPEVQKKAQLELDRVLGSGQLPTFADEASLPYITAIVNECLRWEVVGPLSIPHRSTQDDEYRGYHIPAGTIVIPNTWAVLNDEKVYPDPFTFNPDRFMKNGELNPSVPGVEAAFGYGRRICPGQRMARDSIWLNVACVLAFFDIEKPLDTKGVPYEPVVEYSSWLVRRPEPFECRIKTRSKNAEDLIRGLSVV